MRCPADRVEDDLELGVVFFLERIELTGEVGVRREHLPQADEGAHDFNVDLDGAPAVENAREDGYALLGEDIRGGAPEAAPT